MRQKRKKLLKNLIRAYLEFQERRLWDRFSNFHCLAVEVSGEEAPLLSCVLGAAGEEYGLMLVKGPEAADHLRAFQSFGDCGDDAIDEIDLLSISSDVFGNLPPDLQAFYRGAGIRPGHDEPTPFILSKPPGRRSRQPDDAELSLLVYVLENIVAADRRKLLIPTELDDPGGICILTPAAARGTGVSVRREPLPRRSPTFAKTRALLAPQDLAGLNLLKETWLVGTPSAPWGVAGEERAFRLLLIVEEDSGMVIEGRPFFADRMQEAIQILVESFNGTRLNDGRKGMPRKIIFSSPKLHDATAAAFREAGVQCEYFPTIPLLQEVLADMEDSLGQYQPGKDADPNRADPIEDSIPAPDDLAGWKEADRRLCRRFADFLHHGDRMHSTRAAKRYFDDPDFEHYLQEHTKIGVAMAYASWGVLHYRPTRKGKTEAEKMLARGLPPAQEMLLRARMEAYPSIYRVASHDPKAGTVTLEDVLLGGTTVIYDQLLSESVSNNIFAACRLYAAGRFHFLETAGPPLGVGMGEEAVGFLAECGMEFTREGQRRDANLFGWLWGWVEEWQANWQPPHLTNTDGEELLWHTAAFSVTDMGAVHQALRRRSDIEYDDQEGEYVWLRETGRNVEIAGDPVVLGRIEFVCDELVLSVNSVERFGKARKWLEKLPGIEFKSVTTRRLDEPEEDWPMDERIAGSEPMEITGEMAAALQERVNRQSMKWLDLSIPALGGITPRQACRTPEGRRKVTTLIRTMPDPVEGASVSVPRVAMLRELGLDSGVEETDLGVFSPRAPAGPGAISAGKSKVGRNEPCPCGSGKKFKKCCGR